MSRSKNIRKIELLYILGVEGANQERMYFELLKSLINNVEKRKYNVDFRFSEPFGGDPKCVVERVINTSIGKENKIAVFDYDGKREKFEEALDLCDEGNISIGYTNYCFDLWLIWHKEDYLNSAQDQHSYEPDVKRVFGLSDSQNMKKESAVRKINDQIGLVEIREAIKRAEIVCKNNKLEKDDIKSLNGYSYYNNPDTSIHIILKNIFDKVGI